MLFDEEEEQLSKEESDEQDEGDDSNPRKPSLVHVVILQRKPEAQYESQPLFASPFILSVKSDITYEELYKAVILRLSGGVESGSGRFLKEIPLEFHSSKYLF